MTLSALALAGCDRKPVVTYHGIDLTGSTYATDFRLTDPDGKERTLADFRGKAVLMFFGFTQCPDVCPTALVRAAEVKLLLGKDGERLQTLFITVDPERDTPEVLKAYTTAFDPSFIGLYGDSQRIAEVAKDFKIYYKKVPTGASYTMDHTSLSYVYDPQGKLRLALRHEQPAQDYADDIRKLLNPA
ncbi:SCO family protein [Achromobacter sp.]|jgi:protein SCO1/2|uniref:SCO family protein n=1 Tax=Achromobacter sp. TaxID=134375 RepID=UPI003C73F31A